MLQFKQSDTSVPLLLTLTENVSIPAPYYLFVFTHVTTKEVVAFVKSSAVDESFYTERYNRFTINPSVVFTGKQPGEWHYIVYEQASAVNTNPTLSGRPLEYGKLLIDRAIEFTYPMYDSATQFKVYNG